MIPRPDASPADKAGTVSEEQLEQVTGGCLESPTATLTRGAPASFSPDGKQLVITIKDGPTGW